MPRGTTPEFNKIKTTPCQMFTNTGNEVIINKAEYTPILPIVKVKQEDDRRHEFIFQYVK